MIGVGRSLILRENFKNKTSHAACICSQATCSKKILFSKTFRKIKHDCYRIRSERFNNDFKAGYFNSTSHFAPRKTRWYKYLIIVFLKKYIKQAFEFWGTVWQRVNDQNTVVLRNYSKQNSSIAPSLRNFGTTLKILKYSVHIKFQKRECVYTECNYKVKWNKGKY